MKKLYLLNNLAIGLILVAVWYIDYFYFRRSSRKLSSAAISAYNGIAGKLGPRSPSDRAVAKEISELFIYRPHDTFYIDFINFHKVSPQTKEKLASLLAQVYRTRFKGLHECTIYFRTARVPKTELSAFMHKGAPPFKSAHQSAQNFYHIRIINEDFENKFNLKANTVSLFLSAHKLAEPETPQRIVAKSLFHLKRLNKVGKVKGWTSTAPTPLEGLKQLYLAGLRVRAVSHIEALNYINSNKNLVFIQPYLQELEDEPARLAEAFGRGDLPAIYGYLRKADLAIYDTVYFYEEY